MHVMVKRRGAAKDHPPTITCKNKISLSAPTFRRYSRALFIFLPITGSILSPVRESVIKKGSGESLKKGTDDTYTLVFSRER